MTTNIFVLLEESLPLAAGPASRKISVVGVPGETGLSVTKKIGSEPSELPGPEWYLEHFRGD
jgi:hypothetical protein